jgi:hypothetical protein
MTAVTAPSTDLLDQLTERQLPRYTCRWIQKFAKGG